MSINMFYRSRLRPKGPPQGDERATQVAFLKWYRDTLELRCSGLDAEDLARRAVEPPTPSLLGLVRHMADVERGWFRRVMAGQKAPPHLYSNRSASHWPSSIWLHSFALPCLQLQKPLD